MYFKNKYNNMDDEELHNIVGFVKNSEYRTKTLRFIGESMKMPSEIGEDLHINASQVSNVLADLKSRGLVECKTPKIYKGRLYKNTPLGLKIIKYIDEL